MLKSLMASFFLVFKLFTNEITYAELQDLQPLKNKTIAIDAGHGGQSPYLCSCSGYTGGTYGVLTKQTESEVNLRVAIYTKQYLESLGAKVVMTRMDNCRVSNALDKTSELKIRNKIAEKNKADLFISIHHNYSSNPKTNYGIVFYSKNSKDDSKLLAQWIGKDLSKERNFRGVSQGNYLVLNNSKIPAVLVEASFLSNPDEDKRLYYYTINYQNGYLYWPYNQKEAYSIAKGTALYFLHKEYKDNPYNKLKDYFLPVDVSKDFN